VTEPHTTGQTDTATEAVAAAIGRLTTDSDGGGATAADIAAAARVAYSTTNKKLRALRDTGRVTSFEGPDKRTWWRLTNAMPADTIGGASPAPDPAIDAATEPDPHPRPAAAAVADSDPQAAVPADELVYDGGASADPLPGPTQATDADTNRSGETEPAAALADPPGTATIGDPDAVGDADPGHTTRPAAGRTARSGRSTANSADGAGASAEKLRRPPGSLRGAVLDVLEADPDRQYKVAELCKLIDKASEGTGYVNVGQGAVFNAVVKLVGEHRAVQTIDTPATFQLAAKPAAD
jgi:hypothetical protein